jgi:hypothetical protein
MQLVPDDALAVVHVDLDALRAEPDLAALLPLEGSGDVVGQVVASAHELVFWWTDALLDQRVVAVRGPVDRDALVEALRSGANFTGASFEVLALGGQQAWRARTGDWTVAFPAGDLLLAGDGAPMLAAMARPLPAAAPAGDDAGALAARWTPTPAARALFARAGGRGMAGLLQAIVTARAGATVRGDPHVWAEIIFEPGADVERIAALVEAELAAALRAPDDTLAAQPSWRVTIPARIDSPELRIDLVLPRGQVAWLVAQLTAEPTPAPETP